FSSWRRGRDNAAQEALMARIVLRGVDGQFAGRAWESSCLLRVGRREQLEVALKCSSVSRFHAEIRLTERGLQLRDHGSTNGTRLNGARLGAEHWLLRRGDLVQFADASFLVEEAFGTHVERDTPEGQWAPDDVRSKLRAIPATRISARKARLLAC